MQHVSFANPLVEETTLHELGNQIISKEKYIVRQDEHINALEEEIILMRKSILHLMEENKIPAVSGWGFKIKIKLSRVWLWSKGE